MTETLQFMDKKLEMYVLCFSLAPGIITLVADIFEVDFLDVEEL